MEIYLVGGAVRDKLLGLENSDKDYCVTGATINDMLSQNFTQVGKDFPVFLHPKTKCEYALARTERKTSTGYTGFKVDFNPNITIEEDLYRRDLTINAIAQKDGQLIDPYNGIEDIKNRVLRHVSPAFVEDPLRVIRLARFYARFNYLGFTVANETLELCKEISATNELSTLSTERIWQETDKALKTKSPWLFFEFLKECNALEIVMPQLYELSKVLEFPPHHQEGTTFNHTMLCLKEISKRTTDPIIRFSMLLHDFGKIETNKLKTPNHKGHKKFGETYIKEFCSTLKVPKIYEKKALIISKTHTYRPIKAHTATELNNIFLNLGCYKNPQELEDFNLCNEADYYGRVCDHFEELNNAKLYRTLLNKALKIKVSDVIASGFVGHEISEELNRRRVEEITNNLKLF